MYEPSLHNDQPGKTHMCFHVIQAHVEAPKHVGEFLVAHSISRAGRVEPARGGIQEVIVVEVVLNAVRKFRVSLLGRKKPLALFLEV